MIILQYLGAVEVGAGAGDQDEQTARALARTAARRLLVSWAILNSG